MNNLVPVRSAWMLLAGFAALALILVALLAACGGDAVPGEDADTEAPAPEATDRVRAPAPGSPASDREILVTLYNALDGPCSIKAVCSKNRVAVPKAEHSVCPLLEGHFSHLERILQQRPIRGKCISPPINLSSVFRCNRIRHTRTRE